MTNRLIFDTGPETREDWHPTTVTTTISASTASAAARKGGRGASGGPSVSPAAASTLLFVAAQKVHRPGSSRVKVFRYKNGIRMTCGPLFQEILTASRDLTSFYIEHGYRQGPNSVIATIPNYSPKTGAGAGAGAAIENLIPLIDQNSTGNDRVPAMSKGCSHVMIQLAPSALTVFKTSQIFKRLRSTVTEKRR